MRDVTLSNSDYFALILDTYLDRQNGFVFATTPSGVEYDGRAALSDAVQMQAVTADVYCCPEGG